MYEIIRNKNFKSAYKRVSKSGRFDKERFTVALTYLEKGESLPDDYYDHALRGNLSFQRECHIGSDMLLVYEIHENQKIVVLDDIGNHAQVFES